MNFTLTALVTAATVAAYLAAERLYRRVQVVALHPLLVTSLLGAAVLGPNPDALAKYMEGSWLLQWALGPATAALAVPFFASRAVLASNPAKVLLSVAAGTAASVGTVLGLGALLGAPPLLVRALTIKSVTAPVAISLAPELGVDAGLVGAAVVSTGLFGMAVAPHCFASSACAGHWRAAWPSAPSPTPWGRRAHLKKTAPKAAPAVPWRWRWWPFSSPLPWRCFADGAFRPRCFRGHVTRGTDALKAPAPGRRSR